MVDENYEWPIALWIQNLSSHCEQKFEMYFNFQLRWIEKSWADLFLITHKEFLTNKQWCSTVASRQEGSRVETPGGGG